jgi:adenine-specific DNA-methyltransferase
MAKRKSTTSSKRPIEQYDHKDKERINNPPVGLVTPDTDKDLGKKKYSYDPHLDPQLQWAGKAERLSFEVDTVSLHVHERIDPRSIIEAVRKKNGSNYEQESLFKEEVPLKDAIEFYKHRHNWSNRLIAGDSLLVMNSLIEKEGLAGQVQMMYFDPPYGIKYGSNFQPFVNKRDVKDGKDEDLTAEPETIKAFRDTWELGIHSYLSYLRDRLLLARELLHESGSIFVQISDENVHHVRELMDEVFGSDNFINQIIFKTTGGSSSTLLSTINDYIIFYSKDIKKTKFRNLFNEIEIGTKEFDRFNYVELSDKSILPIKEAFEKGIEVFSKKNRLLDLNFPTSQGFSQNRTTDFEFNGKKFFPGKNRHWSVSKEGMEILNKKNKLFAGGNTLYFKEYLDENPYTEVKNIWLDTQKIGGKLFVVQTNEKVIQRCLLMSTEPGDLVLDITCGSGTSAYVAEQWGRRWITCDTSRVALTLAKQRLMTSSYDYYELAHPNEGVGSGFKYKSVPHITLRTIAYDENPIQETLYDQPFTDNKKTRVTGPFTVEAVPSPAVRSIDETSNPSTPINGKEEKQKEFTANNSIVRSGETLRQSEWRNELLKSGIRGKNGQYILFSRVEPLPGTRWLHADAETKSNDLGADKVSESKKKVNLPLAERVVISFGPEHSPLEQRQVALAIEEAQTLVPKPKIVVFASFQFDPEAAKDIDEMNWPGVTLLKVQMNPDMMTDDLKKKRSSNESFWLIGSPDVIVRKIKSENKKEKDKETLYEVEVLGFDYFNTKTGNIESGGKDRIAMWMLDTDYDGMSLFPRQVFFPMAGEKEGWAKLAKNLKAEIDEELIDAYKGTVSLPFEVGKYQRIAVKIVDDRGIEILKVMGM